jgi:Zn-dependent M32 family carboxypeptidase
MLGAINWLKDKIHLKGAIHSAALLIEEASGAPVRPEPLITYLNDKFR